MTPLVHRAVSFAARAHRQQFRKDGATPYIAHPVRVALTLLTAFDIDDEQTLAAAVLHDTIEDTTTDFDDLAAEFSPEVARYVAALTKDSRLPEEERERTFFEVLDRSPWQVRGIKMADAYDNLLDGGKIPPTKTLEKAKKALLLGKGREAQLSQGVEALARLIEAVESKR
ncbi:MAG TPA: HD domain-containing protein [Pirellulaceae bacterium]|nr:HD domain-containing protein [Pirellulaceae bacterium]